MELTSVKKVNYDLVIIDPVTGEDTDLVFVLQSTDEKAPKRISEKWSEKRKRSKKKVLTTEQEKTFTLEMVKACVVDWKNAEIDGEPFDYCDENKQILVKDERLRWIVDQIGEELAEKSNFLSHAEKD